MRDSLEVGILFIRKEVVWKASHHKEIGIFAWAKRVKPISTMCLGFLYTTPIWWCVWGELNLNWMLSCWRKELNALNSPLIFECRVLIDKLNYFSTRFLKFLRVIKASDFKTRGNIYPAVLSIIINKFM